MNFWDRVSYFCSTETIGLRGIVINQQSINDLGLPSTRRIPACYSRPTAVTAQTTETCHYNFTCAIYFFRWDFHGICFSFASFVDFDKLVDFLTLLHSCAVGHRASERDGADTF